MDCKKARELISPYIDHALNEQETAWLQAHLDICADCRADYELTQKTVSALHDSMVPEPNDFAERLHERLMQEAATPVVRRSVWNVLKPYTGLCAAAVLVLIVRSAYFDVYLPQTRQFADSSISQPITTGAEQKSDIGNVSEDSLLTADTAAEQAENRKQLTNTQTNTKTEPVQPALPDVSEIEQTQPVDPVVPAQNEVAAPFVRMMPESLAESEPESTPTQKAAPMPVQEDLTLAAEPASLPPVDALVPEDAAQPVTSAAFSGGGGGGSASGGKMSGGASSAAGISDASLTTVSPADSLITALGTQTDCPITHTGDTITIHADEDCDTLTEWLRNRPEVSSVQVKNGVITVTLK